MADAPAETYDVEGHKISLKALWNFSTLLPREVSKIVQRTQDITTTLHDIPSSRDEASLFRRYLLKCVLVVMMALYEQIVGDKVPLAIPVGLQEYVSQFESSLGVIYKKISNTQAVITSPHKRRKVKASFVVTSRISLFQDCNQNLRRAMAPFNIETNFTYAARLCNTIRIVKKFTPDPVLETLPRAKYARFDCERPDRPAGCLKGTRTGIIRDTLEWIVYPGEVAKRFFWLNGLAGTGKTTMAHSIASIARSLGILGASFIFSRRGEAELRDPARVFPTIAYQLALFDPEFHALITAALRAEPQAPTGSLEEQLDALIVKPLSRLPRDDETVVVIVLDAFDECEAVGAKTILQLLVAAIPSLPFFLKIFVTSRPEPHIRSVLIPSNNNIQITALHEIKSSVVQGDILLYLRTEIRKLLEKKGLVLPEDWITDVQIELLAHAAGELFIYAKTLLRSLEEAYSLPEQLDSLLKLATRPRTEDDESNPFVYLDELYLEVLRGPITRSNKVQALKLLQVVLGTIVLLRDPLPVDALERLAGMRTGDAHATLNSLYSVILPPAPPGHCPRPYHKSFPDFLQDPARCTDPGLFIDTQKHETRLAIRCLQLLNAKLHEGMLGDLTPILLNSEVRGLKEKVHEAIPAELDYACCNWASHLAGADPENAEIMMGLEKFASKKILAWMESLGWLGSTKSGTTCLKVASNSGWAAKSGVSAQIIRLLDEGNRLLLAHGDTIALSSRHVRQSVLPFSPLNGALASKYSSFANTGVKLIQGFDSARPSSITVSKEHSKGITSIAFSADGTRLASGSYDRTVRLWNTTTGVWTAILTGHSRYIVSVVFSPDGTRLASASGDTTVRLWDATVGSCTTTLTGHSDWVNCVEFSPDGSRLASGSDDGIVLLWDVTTGLRTATLTGHFLSVNSVTFSPDGTRLASGSSDNTAGLWDVTTGVRTATFMDHSISSSVSSVTFSSDGSRLQSEYYGGEVMMWDVNTGGQAENLGFVKFNDGRSNGVSAFEHENGRLYWASNHGRKHLVCILPPEIDAHKLESRRLRAGVEVVVIACNTGRVIIMHVQVPHTVDVRYRNRD